MYRSNAASELVAPEPAPRRVRPLSIALVSVGLHVAVIGAAFAARSKEPARPMTATVQVLAGHVDPWTGDFRASGLRLARIRN